jgi:hypothetical protein
MKHDCIMRDYIRLYSMITHASLRGAADAYAATAGGRRSPIRLLLSTVAKSFYRSSEIGVSAFCHF